MPPPSEPRSPLQGSKRLRSAIEEAAWMVSMTTCPYFEHEGKCDRGCHSEPSCITDEPGNGWVRAALDVLDEALGPR